MDGSPDLTTSHCLGLHGRVPSVVCASRGCPSADMFSYLFKVTLIKNKAEALEGLVGDEHATRDALTLACTKGEP